MSAHKIRPTYTGYFTKSIEFFTDLFLFILISAFTVFSIFSNLNLFLSFLGILFTFVVVYFLKIRKKEYVYITQFFYQVILFFFITPIVFLQPTVVYFISIPIGVLLLFPKKSFRYLDFPFGLFLSVLHVSIFFIMIQVDILNIPFTQIEFPITPQLENENTLGMFFLPKYFLANSIFNLFSIVENYGYILFTLLGIFAILRKNFFNDLIVFILIFFSFLLYYFEDIFIFRNQIFLYTAIWYFLYISIGRNFRALQVESVVSAAITLIFATAINPNNYPPILLMIVFFSVRSILCFYHEKRNSQTIKLRKTE
ncbi:MAG: hypothetical protein L6Q54_06955 [Leptospiraceae bacterium]|nr:hypothetical protein [Leptospiraceae bacterium]MCK6380977.1 hypothetical protein [Leptospiraceae bacterium]NUM41000.1 hypothetical protein [Leptospiraceae bacterium]